jgi:hypothetical protein
LKDENWICGLIIEPVKPASYHRTGYFKVGGDENVQEVVAAWETASYSDEYFIGEVLGPNGDGQKMCIITLI